MPKLYSSSIIWRNMRFFMKKILLFALLVAAVLCLAACGGLEPVDATLPESTEEKREYPEVKNPLTWEQIQTIPLAKEGMTEDELRKICTDFMRLQLTFEWTPSKTLEYTLAGLNKPMIFYRGRVYGGFPYRSFNANGNLYTLMEFYDSETGVLDPGNYPTNDFLGIVGNDCASSPFWAWNRVINSNRNFKSFETESGFTNTGLIPENNLIPVGGYDTISQGDWEDGEGTRGVCLSNGKQKIFEAYTAIKPADGLIHYYPHTGVLSHANHLMMASSAATVVRREDGSIDGDKSFITILDQRSNLTTVHKDYGTVHYEGGVDAVFTFRQLFEEYYVPFTFLEFLGLDPVEPAEAELVCQGDSSLFSDLQKARITANYAISHAKVTFSDETGKECYSYLARPTLLNTRDFSMDKLFLNTASFHADGTKTCRIEVQLGSGHVFCVFEGTVSKA